MTCARSLTFCPSRRGRWSYDGVRLTVSNHGTGLAAASENGRFQ